MSVFVGDWAGVAEVYSGEGRFLGNGTDRRQVQQLDEHHLRIDLAFIGPFKFAGHYIIETQPQARVYRGPANVGYAEPLGAALVDSNSYWANIGLSQRFFLMTLPSGDRQLSLAQLSRGDQLIYTVVGENQRATAGGEGALAFVNGTEYDWATDPAAGRGELSLHRNGTWRGQLTTLNESITTDYVETVQATDRAVTMTIAGVAVDPEPFTLNLSTNGYQAWSEAGEVVGSYNLSGGRALSGYFHHQRPALRVWRREAVAHAGDVKAVVLVAYRGGHRVEAQFGVLRFEAQ